MIDRGFRFEGKSIMSRRPANILDAAEFSCLVRREIGTETNARVLRRMPVFQADHDLPDDMRDMLARLDHAERAHSR
jgi:hypothetical protein